MDNVENLETICQRIIRLDPAIRSARIINGRGHLVAGGMRKGLLSLEAQKQDEMMFTEIALMVRMRHEFDAEFGIVHFTMSYRDKIILISFPLAHDEVFLVSAEKDLDFAKIPFKILKIISPMCNAASGDF